MSVHRARRIDRVTAERLLRGAVSGPDPLAELLAAAAAAPQRDELAGEEAAVAAFREARLVPAPPSRRPSMIKNALAKLLTVKAAAAALAAGTAGGVALAAGTGHLTVSPGGAAPSARPTHHAATPSPASTGSTGGTRPVASSSPAGSPSPSLVGLCRAVRAGAGDNPGKALDNPAFTYLVTVAGGKDKVATYCAALLDAAAATPQPSHPSYPPATHRGDAAATHPTGGPDAHPTGGPHPHPTGAPDAHRSGAPSPRP